MRPGSEAATAFAALCLAGALGAALASGALSVTGVLLAAALAAELGAISLSVRVLGAYLLAGRSRSDPLRRGGPQEHPDADRHRAPGKRHEVLHERLQVDEPRLCSYQLIACTCWSFCGGIEKTGSAPAPGQAEAPRADPRLERLPDAARLPLVRREGIDDCPFRYASPRMRQRCSGGATPNSSASESGA